VLKQRGYATALIGKWHLGDRPAFMPPRQGFDEYYGLPYSNDMWPPNTGGGRFSFPELRLLDGDTLVKHVTADDQKLLTRTFTDKAVSFIERHRAHRSSSTSRTRCRTCRCCQTASRARRRAQPLRLRPSANSTGRWGASSRALEAQRIADRTIVIFMSDNGPWIQYGDHGGSPGPLRAGKHTTFEGGIRVPFLARWPGRVPARTTVETPLMSVDLLPTLARAAGAAFTPAGPIDGVDVLPAHGATVGGPARRDLLRRFHRDRTARGRGALEAARGAPFVDVVPGKGGARGPTCRRCSTCRFSTWSPIPARDERRRVAPTW
jgi:arylsulfatase A-like enzyme